MNNSNQPTPVPTVPPIAAEKSVAEQAGLDALQKRFDAEVESRFKGGVSQGQAEAITLRQILNEHARGQGDCAVARQFAIRREIAKGATKEAAAVSVAAQLKLLGGAFAGLS